MGNTHDAEMSRIEADYLQSEHLKKDYRWGYTEDERGKGPDTWWLRYPSAAGGMQSPVNIVTEDVISDAEYNSNPLRIRYKKSNNTASIVCKTSGDGQEVLTERKILTNTGTAVQLDLVNSQSYITGGPCGNYCYALEKVILHWGESDSHGSEHWVNGRPYSAEVQLVHWNEDLYGSYEEAEKKDVGGIAILSVFVQINNDREENEVLSRLGHLTEDIVYRDQNLIDKQLFVSSLLPDDIMKYWTYSGSLTWPPCYETVTWILFEKPVYVTSKTLKKFRSIHSYCDHEPRPNDEHDGLVLSNCRPIQPIGSRKVIHVDFSNAVRHDFQPKRLQPFLGRRKAITIRSKAFQARIDKHRRCGPHGRHGPHGSRGPHGRRLKCSGGG